MKTLKKHLLTSMTLASIITFLLICLNIVKGTLPVLSFYYIGQLIMALLRISFAIFITLIFIDFLLIQSAKALFYDYKKADKSGKLLIIVVLIIIILRKLLLSLN